MEDRTQQQVWADQFKACQTVEEWNQYIVPQMKIDNDLKFAAAAEAKRRGYRPDKALGIYAAPVKMKATRGRNVLKVGWSQGVLYAEFSSGAVWSYQPVPQEEFFKLTRSPFPDKLFATNIKAKHIGHKVSDPSG